MSTNPGRIDKYELQELLRREGMVEVWKAFDTQAHRYVAIKFLQVNLQADPDFVKRFQRETLAMATLIHPNIVQYYDYSIFQPDASGMTRAYLVMSYVDGGTLADYIRNTSRQGKFPATADIVRLFTTIGTALEYAHQRGMVHGQLKPTNVLLDKRNTSHNATGEPVVTDFGILKLLGGVPGNTGGWQIGIPLYTSPEQIMGAPGDERSDIYSLGIMLYETCTGTLPFPGNNPATIMMQHIHTIPTSPQLINPALPAALTTIITRCIAKDPWARFSTASAFIEALIQDVGQEMKGASTVSSPINVSQPDYSIQSMDLPTVFTGPSSLAPGTATSTPSSPGIPGVSYSPLSSPGITPGSGSQMPAYNYMTPSFSSMAGSSQPYPTMQPAASLTPMPPTVYPGQPAQGVPATSSTPPYTPSPKPRRRALRIVLVAVLILALIGSGLGAYFVFFSKSAPPTATGPSLVGHAYFVSSGLLGPDTGSSQGITDQLQLRLQNIAPPPTNKVYFAWLLNAKGSDWFPIPLGPLSVNNGVGVLSYPGEAAHSDLLATNSRFFITTEDAGTTPVAPSQNVGTLLYYAEFSQVPDPTTAKHFSLYDHIRHLLANDPKIVAAGLTGGLDIWLYRNTQNVLGWANSARDLQQGGTTALPLMQRQLTRILDYLDGTFYIQHDLPGQNLLVDPTVAKIGLLTFDPAKQVNNPGYVYHITTHLHDIASLPQTSPTQKAIANQIYTALNGVNVWLNSIRNDILQLFSMPQAQLLGSQARALLDDIATLANNAFVGQVNNSGQVLDGVAQIHYAIQHLATFDVVACTTANPCPSLAS